MFFPMLASSSTRFPSLIARTTFIAIPVLFLAGCASYEPRKLDATATQARLDTRSFGSSGLKTFLEAHSQPVEGQAWDIARLTLAGFYFSPELDVARARIAEAEAGVRTARARPNPTFGFTPGYNVDAVAGVTPWILEYALGVPLELAGKRQHRTVEAQHLAVSTQLDLARSAWTVRAAVRQSLIELHGAEATAELSREQLPLLAQASQLIDLQVEAGEVSPLQAAQARIALNRAQLALRESERAMTLARSRLAESIGMPLVALADIKLSYEGLADAPDAFDSSAARRWAAQNRADLLAALSVYAASEARLRGEIARQYPDLSFGPGYQIDQGEGKWSLGLGITLPALHRNEGPIAAAQARREAEAAGFLVLQNRVLAEVDRASTDYSAALADFETVKAIRESLEHQTKTIRAQHAAGETSRLELVSAQIEFADMARADLEARLRLEQAIGALENAVQRPLAWPESAWRTAARSNSH